MIRVRTDEMDAMTLTPEEEYVVFAALCTMLKDVHSVQDQMTEEQWRIAESVYERLDKCVTARESASL